ncbi:hypothetical protein [Sphingomonas nostoxanthinifaciens]|uniref:hypothetical protein n=1 Tax=Sphingomonas nostoxanthinifaciens TaxID=2872652 RepID=UPI001CC1C457|nr:hypothetical protein [Sphingomonas nostoxanthinifaciens]UAK25631.1 hypothetical protein K8P63_05645 [Sphingomonas nostoxanthinifaciens]
MNDPQTGQRPETGGTHAFATSEARAGLDHAASAASSASDAAGDVAGEVKGQASSLVGQVKDKALATANEQKEGIAGQIDLLAAAVHKSGEPFAGQQDWIASAIERGATELGSLASALRENDLSSLLAQVNTLARRQPALFVGASLAAGFAVARLGKLVAADVSRDDLPKIPEVGHGDR